MSLDLPDELQINPLQEAVSLENLETRRQTTYPQVLKNFRISLIETFNPQPTNTVLRKALEIQFFSEIFIGSKSIIQSRIDRGIRLTGSLTPQEKKEIYYISIEKYLRASIQPLITNSLHRQYSAGVHENNIQTLSDATKIFTADSAPLPEQFVRLFYTLLVSETAVNFAGRSVNGKLVNPYGLFAYMGIGASHFTNGEGVTLDPMTNSITPPLVVHNNPLKFVPLVPDNRWQYLVTRRLKRTEEDATKMYYIPPNDFDTPPDRVAFSLLDGPPFAGGPGNRILTISQTFPKNPGEGVKFTLRIGSRTESQDERQGISLSNNTLRLTTDGNFRGILQEMIEVAHRGLYEKAHYSRTMIPGHQWIPSSTMISEALGSIPYSPKRVSTLRIESDPNRNSKVTVVAHTRKGERVNVLSAASSTPSNPLETTMLPIASELNGHSAGVLVSFPNPDDMSHAELGRALYAATIIEQIAIMGEFFPVDSLPQATRPIVHKMLQEKDPRKITLLNAELQQELPGRLMGTLVTGDNGTVNKVVREIQRLGGTNNILSSVLTANKLYELAEGKCKVYAIIRLPYNINGVIHELYSVVQTHNPEMFALLSKINVLKKDDPKYVHGADTINKTMREEAQRVGNILPILIAQNL